MVRRIDSLSIETDAEHYFVGASSVARPRRFLLRQRPSRGGRDVQAVRFGKFRQEVRAVRRGAIRLQIEPGQSVQPTCQSFEDKSRCGSERKVGQSIELGKGFCFFLTLLISQLYFEI